VRNKDLQQLHAWLTKARSFHTDFKVRLTCEHLPVSLEWPEITGAWRYDRRRFTLWTKF